jgi:hypothetical protein
MPVTMIRDAIGIADPNGVTTKTYEVGEVIDTSVEWKEKLAKGFLDSGSAEETQAITTVGSPENANNGFLKEKKKARKKRSKK